MDPNEKKKVLIPNWHQGSVEALQSLNKAIQEAGGTIPTMKELETWTVTEMLKHYGPNHIRFVWIKPEE